MVLNLLQAEYNSNTFFNYECKVLAPVSYLWFTTSDILVFDFKLFSRQNVVEPRSPPCLTLGSHLPAASSLSPFFSSISRWCLSHDINYYWECLRERPPKPDGCSAWNGFRCWWLLLKISSRFFLEFIYSTLIARGQKICYYYCDGFLRAFSRWQETGLQRAASIQRRRKETLLVFDYCAL